MVLFLTSSPTGALDGSYRVEGLDERNGFVEMLRRYWPKRARVLMATARPDADEANAEMIAYFAEAVRKMGLPFDCFDLLDGISAENCDVGSYNVLLLGGGHVPTQNTFFDRIRLRQRLAAFDGVVVGISAGSMNAAGMVYAQPEEPGEAIDPEYRRFIPGLGLTDVNVLPHYQMVRSWTKDGLRLIEDITLGDSWGRRFLALPDGSFVVQRMGTATVYGEAYLLTDGRIEKICEQEKYRDI